MGANDDTEAARFGRPPVGTLPTSFQCVCGATWTEYVEPDMPNPACPICGNGVVIKQ